MTARPKEFSSTATGTGCNQTGNSTSKTLLPSRLLFGQGGHAHMKPLMLPVEPVAAPDNEAKKGPCGTGLADFLGPCSGCETCVG